MESFQKRMNPRCPNGYSRKPDSTVERSRCQRRLARYRSSELDLASALDGSPRQRQDPAIEGSIARPENAQNPGFRRHVEFEEQNLETPVVLLVEIETASMRLVDRPVAVLRNRAPQDVHDLDLGSEEDPGPGGADARAEGDVFGGQEEVLVEPGNGLEPFPPAANTT